MRRALVAGWFSFEEMGATSGDLSARDLAVRWLKDVGFDVDVAAAEPFVGDVRIEHADPRDYSHLVFVCGPFGNGWPISDLLRRFADCRVVGLNLSMLEPLEAWNPFDALIERDSSRRSHPDITFALIEAAVPVIGVVLVHPQTEYAGCRHADANAAVERLVRRVPCAPVAIDTRLDWNSGLLRTPAAVESVIARMDAVITTRVHGLVTALKHGVPVLAIDPIAGEAKVSRQAEAIGWPYIFQATALDDAALEDALHACLRDDTRRLARELAAGASTRVAELRLEFIASLER